jgi:hypothetical protein
MPCYTWHRPRYIDYLAQCCYHAQIGSHSCDLKDVYSSLRFMICSARLYRSLYLWIGCSACSKDCRFMYFEYVLTSYIHLQQWQGSGSFKKKSLPWSGDHRQGCIHSTNKEAVSIHNLTVCVYIVRRGIIDNCTHSAVPTSCLVLLFSLIERLTICSSQATQCMWPLLLTSYRLPTAGSHAQSVHT